MKNGYDNYGRGPQSATIQTLKLAVEVYKMVNGEIGKMIEQKWIEFKTFCTELPDIDEELNVSNKNPDISYNIISIVPA